MREKVEALAARQKRAVLEALAPLGAEAISGAADGAIYLMATLPDARDGRRGTPFKVRCIDVRVATQLAEVLAKSGTAQATTKRSSSGSARGTASPSSREPRTGSRGRSASATRI